MTDTNAATPVGGHPLDPPPGDPRDSALSLSTGSDLSGLSPCGTWAAYKRHLKRGEDVCEACAEACRRQARERYRADPEPKRRKVRERYRDKVAGSDGF